MIVGQFRKHAKRAYFTVTVHAEILGQVVIVALLLREMSMLPSHCNYVERGGNGPHDFSRFRVLGTARMALSELSNRLGTILGVSCLAAAGVPRHMTSHPSVACSIFPADKTASCHSTSVLHFSTPTLHSLYYARRSCTTAMIVP